jgi:hypothetical protein
MAGEKLYLALGTAPLRESKMQRLVFIFMLISTSSLTAVTQTSQNSIVFLDQTKAVKGGLEWNREIVAKNAGSMAIKITIKEGGKFSVLLITDEDYQVIIGKKAESENFKPKLIINVDASNSFEKTLSLEKGTYWFIIENQEEAEKNINLKCSEIR